MEEAFCSWLTMSSAQDTQGFIHSVLENLQGQRMPNLSGQIVPLLSCPDGEFYFPYSQAEPLLFQLISMSFFHHVPPGRSLFDTLLVGSGIQVPPEAISSPG